MISNMDILADIAVNATDSKIVSKAIEKINDDSFLIGIVKNGKGPFRNEAAQKINDQSVLIEIAKNDEDFLVRATSAQKISDESVLIDIAKNDENSYVRRAAAQKISDESVLIDIAMNDEDAYVRRAAAQKISDESVLDDIALNEEKLTKVICEKCGSENMTVKSHKAPNPGYSYCAWRIIDYICNDCGNIISKPL